MALQGAQVLRWVPGGERPVIWLSPEARFTPGKAVRGGVPVCWPWFGPHPGRPELPAHGFARTEPWQVTATEAPAEGGIRLSLRLAAGEKSLAQWPHRAELQIHIRVGATLEIELVTHNLGAEPIAISEALHAYFELSDVREVAIRGLEGRPYLDKVEGGRRERQSGAVRIRSETDRIYLDATADCLIEDRPWGRRIRVAKRGSRSTVVWNPWVEKAAELGDLGEDGYLRMVCVESANAADDLVTIPPDGVHRLWTRYSVEPLS